MGGKRKLDSRHHVAKLSFMRPSTAYRIAMPIVVLGLVAAAPMAGLISSVMSVGTYIFLDVCLYALVIYLTRCPRCGMPICLRFHERSTFRYTYSGIAAEQCSRCGRPL